MLGVALGTLELVFVGAVVRTDGLEETVGLDSADGANEIGLALGKVDVLLRLVLGTTVGV